MNLRRIQSIQEVALFYFDQLVDFKAKDQEFTKFPFNIINEIPWSICFDCPKCGNYSNIFEYNPIASVKTPVQPNFLRLVPCYSKYYTIVCLNAIAESFKGVELLQNYQYSFIASENQNLNEAFSHKVNLAYSECGICSQEFLARYMFHYPDNDRKEHLDPVICKIIEIIQADITIASDISKYVKLQNA